MVYISKRVSLSGGYVAPFDAQADPIARPTTLNAQECGRVVYIVGDITVTLTGLHITRGDATADCGWSSRRTGVNENIPTFHQIVGQFRRFSTLFKAQHSKKLLNH